MSLLDFYFLLFFSVVADLMEIVAYAVGIWALPVFAAVPWLVAGASAVLGGIAWVFKILHIHSLQVISEALALGPYAMIGFIIFAWFFGLLIDLAFNLYFALKGKNVLKSVFLTLLEAFPVAEWLPIRTFMIIFIYFTSKGEEKIEETLEGVSGTSEVPISSKRDLLSRLVSKVKSL